MKDSKHVLNPDPDNFLYCSYLPCLYLIFLKQFSISEENPAPLCMLLFFSDTVLISNIYSENESHITAAAGDAKVLMQQ